MALFRSLCTIHNLKQKQRIKDGAGVMYLHTFRSPEIVSKCCSFFDSLTASSTTTYILQRRETVGLVGLKCWNQMLNPYLKCRWVWKVWVLQMTCLQPLLTMNAAQRWTCVVTVISYSVLIPAFDINVKHLKCESWCLYLAPALPSFLGLCCLSWCFLSRPVHSVVFNKSSLSHVTGFVFVFYQTLKAMPYSCAGQKIFYFISNPASQI